MAIVQSDVMGAYPYLSDASVQASEWTYQLSVVPYDVSCEFWGGETDRIVIMLVAHALLKNHPALDPVPSVEAHAGGVGRTKAQPTPDWEGDYSSTSPGRAFLQALAQKRRSVVT